MRAVIGYSFLFVGLFVEVFCATYLKEPPSWLEVCNLKQDNYENCLIKDIQNFMVEFRNGYPGFTGFQTLDPFKIKKIYVDENRSGAVNFKMILSDIRLNAFKNVVVTGSKHLSATDWRLVFFFPKLRMEGKYTMDGRLLVVPIRGEGKFLLETDDMETIIAAKVKLFERDNHSFYNITRVKVDYTIGGFKINAENLFNGNKELSDATNAFLNENWQDVSEAMKPTILRSLEEIMREVSRSLFDFVPADFFIKDIRKRNKGSQ